MEDVETSVGENQLSRFLTEGQKPVFQFSFLKNFSQKLAPVV